MRVVLSSIDGYVYPALCPCCLGKADLVETVEGSTSGGSVTTTARVRMPVCSSCLEHRKEGWNEASIAVIAGCVLFGLAMVLRMGFDARRGSFLYNVAEVLGMLFVASLVAAPVVFFWWRRRWSRMHPPHARTASAVRVQPTSLGVAFEFANESYGAAFRDLNADRLER